ncbi:hypothetical protein KUCAC02_029803 [Chaenocephalus aceratus]|nr:hypothetical protein KUCAC02_029803 [Chaenocephalus aceratus]
MDHKPSFTFQAGTSDLQLKASKEAVRVSKANSKRAAPASPPTPGSWLRHKPHRGSHCWGEPGGPLAAPQPDRAPVRSVPGSDLPVAAVTGPGLHGNHSGRASGRA